MPQASITTCVGRRLREEARELRSIQTLALADVPMRIRDRELEDSLCEVHSHCRSIHLGLLLVALMGDQLIAAHHAASEPGGVHTIVSKPLAACERRPSGLPNGRRQP